ncbi:CHAT domain-containing protein [Alsobacter sp. SYSU M60028]|uniref:CHAT domain-containing protein n=1 Tax=Alsobacter ponti TaxID=2962936 RepID=A0ABT1L7G7_9HYPH|nr:CHAT domain-containing tetratricopeptide repeat protein [Alsobacter ponti]MCP8937426.1 CHAT domain-containing protein [Alsobacter ponti]
MASLVLAGSGAGLAQSRPAAPPAGGAPGKPGSLSVSEALAIANRTVLVRPAVSRAVADIARLLDQYKPDPRRIQALRDLADRRTPADLKGAALADFLMERGLAARDLGRTQQRLADLKEAYLLVKPQLLLRSPIWVADFPTPANPDGSPAFQAYVEQKRAAKRAAMGAPMGMGGGGGIGRPGPGLGPGGPRPRNIDLLPKTPEEANERLAERVTPEQQRAVRILQAYVIAEMDVGHYRQAQSAFEEVRASLLTVMAGAVVSMDRGLIESYTAVGDLDGARRGVARIQQVVSLTRQFSFLSTQWNNQAAYLDGARGDVALAAGQPGEAEARFRSAMRLQEAAIKDSARWPSRPNPGAIETEISALRLKLGQALLRQKRLIEAEIETRRALFEFLKLQGVNGPKTARTVLMLAEILQMQGRFKDARKLGEMALDVYQRAGVDTALHADAYQRIALAQAAQGEWGPALDTYARLRTALAGGEAGRRRSFDLNLDLAAMLLGGHRAGEAVPILEAILAQREAQGADPYALAEARGLLGVALGLAGKLEGGLNLVQGAMPVLLAGRDDAEAEDDRWIEAQRRRLVADAYFGLLLKLRGSEAERKLGLDATALAFQLAEAANAQSVHSAIAAANARSVADPALAELIRQTQDADQHLAALKEMVRTALDAPASEQNARALQSLRTAVADLQRARLTLRRDIERRFPAYAELLHPRPVALEGARAALRPGQALLVTHFVEGRGYVWAVPREGDIAFSPMGLSEADLSLAVDEVLKSVTGEARSLEALPAFPVEAAHRIFDAVLAPVAAGWQGREALIVVASGPLQRLPAGMLVTRPTPQPAADPAAPRFAEYRGVPFLIRDMAVSQIPSVAALAALTARPSRLEQRKPFLGFGDPWFNGDQAHNAMAEEKASPVQLASAAGERRSAPTKLAAANAAAPRGSAPPSAAALTAELALLPRLPDTRRELREVAEALGAGPDDVLTGARASEQAVRSTRLDDRRVIMFATHGLVPGDLEGLAQPALALSSPEVPGVEGDGLLTLDDVLGLKLDADWIVLSACNTASAEAGNAEAASGLGRAFFYAGARALLATAWPVETRSARVLTTRLFGRQAADPALTRAAALRLAALDLLDKETLGGAGARISMGHPLFWAPFILIGDGN